MRILSAVQSLTPSLILKSWTRVSVDGCVWIYEQGFEWSIRREVQTLLIIIILIISFRYTVRDTQTPPPSHFFPSCLWSFLSLSLHFTPYAHMHSSVSSVDLNGQRLKSSSSPEKNWKLLNVSSLCVCERENRMLSPLINLCQLDPS